MKPFELDIAGPHAAAHVNTQRYLRALHLMLRFGVAGGMPWHRDAADYFALEPVGRIELLRAVEDALRGYHPGLYRAPLPPERPPPTPPPDAADQRPMADRASARSAGRRRRGARLLRSTWRPSSSRGPPGR